jgi:hypothetical protein
MSREKRAVRTVADVKREQRVSGLRREYAMAKERGGTADELARIAGELVGYGGEDPGGKPDTSRAASKRAATRSVRGS